MFAYHLLGFLKNNSQIFSYDYNSGVKGGRIRHLLYSFLPQKRTGVVVSLIFLKDIHRFFSFSFIRPIIEGSSHVYMCFCAVICAEYWLLDTEANL